MKSSKSEIRTKSHKIPTLRFEDQNLTSFSGLVLLQALFCKLALKSRLQKCFGHIRKSSIYQAHTVVILLVVHLMLGFRRLSAVAYYHDDPMVKRLMGLRSLPDVSTISRTLGDMDKLSVEQYRALNRELVLDGLRRQQFPRVTLDFDGSVLSTKGHAEGTAIGYNKKKKGARSYYPLFSTVAQTGQFFDMHHRPGNVHDHNGAEQFMVDCYDQILQAFPRIVLESRADSAFFSDAVVSMMDVFNVQYTISVPFERFPELKGIVESRTRWQLIDEEWSYFERRWKPESWTEEKRFLFIRHRTKKPHKGPLQLDLFIPRSFDYEYKVIVTSKKETAQSVIQFHNGRGSQEGLFGEAKQFVGLDIIPCRRLHSNQVFTTCSMLAHNLSREMQMIAAPKPRAACALPKRPAAWLFNTIDTIRRRLIQRAGRLARPQGKLTLTMSGNESVKRDLINMLEAIKEKA